MQQGPPARGSVEPVRGHGIMTVKTSFRGSFTALVTPFSNGSVDEQAFRGLIDWQIAEGTDGLVPAGTTGESPTLSHDQHRRGCRACATCPSLRRDCGAGRNAVLQQADPGRLIPALQGDK